ncbi:MAG: GntR family transcriptional regulator [Peptococcaceae bacterium]|nr:GntR family transcriptional regulator [Candidatus Syntrophopropionicum ammoniitolerans]
MQQPRLVPIKLNDYKPLRELVFDSLRKAIIHGKLRPGERLMEIQLAEEMGVSRTPVREAIRKLELDGFVVMVPRRGAYVAGVSVKDIADVFEVRSALEGLAAGLAAERITEEEMEELEKVIYQISGEEDVLAVVKKDNEFHELIYKASRNRRLTQIIKNLSEQISRFRLTSLSVPGRLKIAVDEHKKIIEAICERDVDLANKLASEHMENAEQNLINAIREEEG